MPIVSRDNLHESSSLSSGENKTNIINLLFAEFTKKVVKVKYEKVKCKIKD